MNIYILYGQTATGKTAKALELAKEQNGEIINFDSRQIYKKLNIVTGKDVPKNYVFHNFEIKHEHMNIGYYSSDTERIWLYDIVDPKQPFSSADYVSCVFPVVKDIVARGKTPILVGGTGYYLYHLLYGVPKIDVPENWDLRRSLAQKTVAELQHLLQEKNPDMLAEMNESDRANPRRLIRRIEIASAGKSLPKPPKHEVFSTHFGSLVYLPFFHTQSEETRAIIRNRIMQRLEDGAVEELQGLLNDGYTLSDPGLNAIGYSQIGAYIRNETTREQMIENWLTSEIQYAKRQKTFFKKLNLNPLE